MALFLATFTATALESHGWQGYARLKRGGLVTEATVERVDPANHCQVDYGFNVADVTYHGRGSGCWARVGERVVVTYLIADPAQSCLGLAKDKLTNELIPIILASVLGPPMIILVNLAKRRWREDQGSA